MSEENSKENNEPKKQPSNPLTLEPETVIVTKSFDTSKMDTKKLN